MPTGKSADLVQHYETFVHTTESGPVRAMNHNMRLLYFAIGLCGEAGEAAEKIKKLVRDHDGLVPDQQTLNNIVKELGDPLWYLAQLCEEVTRSCFSSEYVDLRKLFETNMEKLQDRLDRNVIQGSGDNR